MDDQEQNNCHYFNTYLGVYMEVDALQQLNDMRFAGLTGFEMINSDNKDRIEKFTNHPLNGDLLVVNRKTGNHSGNHWLTRFGAPTKRYIHLRALLIIQEKKFLPVQ